MPIGDLQNQNDSPLGTRDYRPPVDPENTPDDGDIMVWSVDKQALVFLPSLIVQQFSDDGTINDATSLVINTGDNDLGMPMTYNRILEIKSVSGTASLDPFTNTIEGGDKDVDPTVARRFFLDGTVWLEL
jgi:hypothetical protein